MLGPIRQELLDAIEAAGPCAVRELAVLLGRPADTLYFHLRRLVAVGLVKELARRREGRHVVAVYDLTARNQRLHYGPGTDRGLLNGVVAAAVRLSMREFAAALKGPRMSELARDGRLAGGRAKGWLTRAQQRRVKALLDEAAALIRSGRPGLGGAGGGREAVALGFVWSPCVVKARVASTSKSTFRTSSPRVSRSSS